MDNELCVGEAYRLVLWDMPNIKFIWAGNSIIT